MRGQLTFWVLLALSDNKKHAAEINIWITEVTNGTVKTDLQNLYRALRRYDEAELVEHTTLPNSVGPDRKLYYLTELGESLLAEFIKQNIANFYHPLIKKSLENKSNKP